MPDQNGYQTRQELSADWAAAEDRLKAHRTPADIAALPTAKEAAAKAAAELRFTTADTARMAALRASIAAQGTPREAEATREYERCYRAAQDALSDRVRVDQACGEASRQRRVKAWAEG